MTAAIVAKLLAGCSTLLLVIGAGGGHPVALGLCVAMAVFSLVAIHADHEAREARR